MYCTGVVYGIIIIIIIFTIVHGIYMIHKWQTIILRVFKCYLLVNSAAYDDSVAAVTMSPNTVGFGLAARPTLCRLINTHPSSRKHIFAAQVLGCMDFVTKYMHIKSTKSIKSTTEYVPSLELGLSHPLSHQRVGPSPRTGGGGTLAWGEGLGQSQFRRLEKKLSTLPTLWILSRFLHT